MINIYNIVKSRFIDGESLPSWYEDRLGVCAECPLNSKNIDSTSKNTLRKSWELIAGAHCTDPSCGCTITEKAKIEEEFCPKSKWGSVKSQTFNDLDIENLDNKVAFIFAAKDQKYIADYGDIPYRFESSFTLIIKDESIKDLIVRTSCGCTSATPRVTKKGILLSIKYDTTRVGSINKTVKLNYKINGKDFQTIISIKGNVKNQK